jgi:hypothetical protein
MTLQVEDLDDQTRFRQILAISYNDLVQFILDNIKEKTALTLFFWSACILFLGMAVSIRINMAGYFPASKTILHASLGLIIFPVLCVPVHELLHVIPYYLSGARNIRAGVDLKQYLFYVTAHRHVATPIQFRIVAIIPFLIITIVTMFLVLSSPGLWKWSLSLFLFVHTTMCAGDFAMLNYYYINKNKKIYTWDDADEKIAYFYEEIGEE